MNFDVFECFSKLIVLSVSAVLLAQKLSGDIQGGHSRCTKNEKCSYTKECCQLCATPKKLTNLFLYYILLIHMYPFLIHSLVKK